MCHFLDAEGRSVAHPVQDRVMSVGLDVVAGARHVVLASGGRRRAAAIRATIARIGCHTLVTDEAAARALLDL
jgi:DNA-binding transcriptional regulator LsrR (DeoR family)